MKIKRVLILMILILIGFFSPLTNQVKANSMEPPRIVIVVQNAPEDLELALKFADNPTSSRNFYKKKVAWETHYSFAKGMLREPDQSYDNAILVVQSSETSFEIPLPEEAYVQWDNACHLDLNNQSLTVGVNPVRTALLVLLRISLTLIIEGLVFYAFGYRQKASWIIFLVVNLVTQVALNFYIIEATPALSAYLGTLFTFILAEGAILIAEPLAYALTFKEQSRSRAAVYGVVANLASIALGIVIFFLLPI